MSDIIISHERLMRMNEYDHSIDQHHANEDEWHQIEKGLLIKIE